MNHSCRIHLADGIIHAVGRSVKETNPAKLSHPTSILSGEKEVSHGHEEGKEEEDVEVTSTSASLACGRALASYFARHRSLMTAVGLKAGRCCFSRHCKARCGTLSLAPRYDFGPMAGPRHLVGRFRSSNHMGCPKWPHSVDGRPKISMPDLRPPETESDFYFVQADDPETAVSRIIELVKTRIPKRFGLDPIRDIQVLCPMNRGGVGARSLNIELQAALNPAGDIKSSGSAGPLPQATR
jgi:hypothetical protein